MHKISYFSVKIKYMPHKKSAVAHWIYWNFSKYFTSFWWFGTNIKL